MTTVDVSKIREHCNEMFDRFDLMEFGVECIPVEIESDTAWAQYRPGDTLTVTIRFKRRESQ